MTVPSVTITFDDVPSPICFAPELRDRPSKGDVRYVPAGRWELVKCVHDGEVWRAGAIVASATCIEALVAANVLLSDQAEMGLPTPWRPQGSTFHAYAEDGSILLHVDDDDDEEDAA